MKINIQEYTLLYDAYCPLCQAYSNAFIKFGFLNKEGRLNWNEISDSIKSQIDVDRSRHEIALVNVHTGDVFYGIDSLFTILSSNLKWFNILFNYAFLKILFKFLYNVISYNRHLIIPRDLNNPSKCVPDFSLFWRVFYIAISIFVTAFVLHSFSNNILVQPYSLLYDFLIILAHFTIQSIVLYFIQKEKSILDYITHNATIMFIGSLFLLPAIGLSYWFQNAYFFLTYLSVVVFITLYLHHKRMLLLKYNIFLTITWILFSIILAFLINENFSIK